MRRSLTSFLVVFALASIATTAVAQENVASDASDGYVAAEDRLALAQEAVEIDDMTSGPKKIASTGSTVDAKYPGCPPSPPRGKKHRRNTRLTGNTILPPTARGRR